jgi:hypothetical protein
VRAVNFEQIDMMNSIDGCRNLFFRNKSKKEKLRSFILNVFRYFVSVTKQIQTLNISVPYNVVSV